MTHHLPKTFNPGGSAEGAKRPQLFDPALKHLPSAFRPGDPELATPEQAGRWHAARRQATDHVLSAVANSAWGEHFVLRGSRLMKAWLGDAAREPGDLDYVVRPASAKLGEPWSARLLSGLKEAVAARPAPPGVAFLNQDVTHDDIWTYERAAGRRTVFPWRAAGLPGGAVQVDVVFGETLGEPAELAPVETADGNSADVWAATPGESLAWKLVWLAGDMYPQGKDLYDAALLAERVFLPHELLARALRAAGAEPLPMLAWQFTSALGRIDWANFQQEYPWMQDSARVWLDRLTRALAPTFADCPQPERSKVLDPGWLTSDVLGLAEGVREDRAFHRLPVLADALEEAGCADADILGHGRAGQEHDGSCWLAEWLRPQAAR